MNTSTSWPQSCGEATSGNQLSKDFDLLVNTSARSALAHLKITTLDQLESQNPLDLFKRVNIPAVYQSIATFVNSAKKVKNLPKWPFYSTVAQYFESGNFYLVLNRKQNPVRDRILLEVLGRRDNPSLVVLARYSPDEIAKLARDLSEEAYGYLREQVVDTQKIIPELEPWL